MNPNIKKLQACIFDLDGVLVDTAGYHFLSWQKIANQIGIKFTKIDNEHLKGVSRKESLEYILNLGNVKLSEKEKVDLMIAKNELYLDFISTISSDDLLPGVNALLESLKNNGIKIALGSASKNAVPVLHSTKIYHYFDTISDGNSTTKSKPDPEVFLIAASGLDTLPKSCIVFEDAQKGIDAALFGGFYCIGIGYENLVGAHFSLKDFDNIYFEDILKIYSSIQKVIPQK
jgi:beta-phosphoglucomutase